MVINCCKGCQDRCAEPNCHMTCERYLTQRAARDLELKQRYKEGIINSYKTVVSMDIQEAMQHMHKQQKRRK